MTKQLGALDISFLAKELKVLEKSRVDRIYNSGKEEVFIQFYKSGEGKQILRVIVGKGLFISKTKDSDTSPSDFCMLLRKHLEGRTLESLEQLKPERILKLVLKSKDGVKNVYIENFAKGNLILCDEKDTIIDSLTRHKFKDRTILHKHKYTHPDMKYDLFSLSKGEISKLFKNSNKDKIVTSLATELGLGGIYSEEVCLLSRVDKNNSPKKIDNKEITIISEAIKKLINKKNNSKIIYEDDKALDVVPFGLEFYNDNKKKEFSSYNSALEHYYTKEIILVKKKESKNEQQIKEFTRIIKEQEETLEGLKKKEKDNKKKAELIYSNYQLIKEILDEINKASGKLSWEDIKKKLKGHRIVKDVDVKEKKVVVEV